MTRIKFVHVIEFDSGERNIRPGKGDLSGAYLTIPTPENDREEFERLEWERVDYWQLPESMTKSEFKEWWNDNVDSDPRPSPIPDVLEAMNGGDV